MCEMKKQCYYCCKELGDIFLSRPILETDGGLFEFCDSQCWYDCLEAEETALIELHEQAMLSTDNMSTQGKKKDKKQKKSKKEKKNKKSFWEHVYDYRMEGVEMIQNPKKYFKKQVKRYSKMFGFK